MENDIKTALITGASAGIGAACAKLFAKEGYQLILAARRAEKLNEVAEAIKKEYPIAIHQQVLDVRILKDVEQFYKNIPAAFQKINVIINNAGLASGLSNLEDGEIDNWERMIDTNIKGLLYVTKFGIPFIPKNNTGHIINIGSIAGKEIYMNGNVYCATKHAVNALSQSMRLELSEYPIKVTGIHPGAVETEFSIVRYNGDQEKAKKVYEGYDNLLAEDIAEAAFWAVSRPSRVNINDMVIMPTAQPRAGVIHRK